MNKLEEMARALSRQYMLDDGYSEATADRAAAGDMWRNFRAMARVAISTMREPTPSMVEKGTSKIWDEMGSPMAEGSVIEDVNFIEGWKAAIDAALEKSV